MSSEVGYGPEVSCKAARERHASRILGRVQKINERLDGTRGRTMDFFDDLVGQEPQTEKLHPGNPGTNGVSGTLGEINNVLDSIEEKIGIIDNQFDRA